MTPVDAAAPIKHIYGFNALRALSVTLVILSHLGIIGASTGFAHTFFTVFNADFGVKTFFVLSGFLIHVLLIREFERSGRIDIRAFMIRRAFRILPLYYLALAFAAVLAAFGLAEEARKGTRLALLFVYNYVPHVANVNYFSHFWSIAVEEQFYLFAPLIFASLVPKRGALLAAGLILLFVCAAVFQVGYGGLSQKFATNRWTFPAIYAILIGSMMAIAIHNPSYGKLVRRIIANPLCLALSVTIILRPLAFEIPLPSFVIVDALGVAGLIGWIFLNQSNVIVRNMDWGPIGYIGMISYGLYIWQGIFTGNGPYRSFPGWPPEPYVGILITLVVAPISYHLFERPVMALRERFTRRTVQLPTTQPLAPRGPT